MQLKYIFCEAVCGLSIYVACYALHFRISSDNFSFEFATSAHNKVLASYNLCNKMWINALKMQDKNKTPNAQYPISDDNSQINL